MQKYDYPLSGEAATQALQTEIAAILGNKISVTTAIEGFTIHDEAELNAFLELYKKPIPEIDIDTIDRKRWAKEKQAK